MPDKGQQKDNKAIRINDQNSGFDNFVLDKGIFSNVFEKDIKRVYIYKKSERLAKAIHLVAPAFKQSPALRNRVDAIAVGLVDAATLPPLAAREALSRELLALSSVLSIARVGGLLSSMNAELIAREAHTLLQEIAAYEEPRMFLDESPTLAALFKSVAALGQGSPVSEQARRTAPREPSNQVRQVKDNIAVVKDTSRTSSRTEAILEILRSKGPSYIKDISTVIRDVSEKTIQRELQSLVASGRIRRVGERRWSQYSLLS